MIYQGRWTAIFVILWDECGVGGGGGVISGRHVAAESALVFFSLGNENFVLVGEFIGGSALEVFSLRVYLSAPRATSKRKTSDVSECTFKMKDVWSVRLHCNSRTPVRVHR